MPLPQQNDPAAMEKAIYSEARKALEKIFPPELMGRFGSKIVPFRCDSAANIRGLIVNPLFYVL